MSEDLNEFGTLVPKRLAEALAEENARLKAEVDGLVDYLRIASEVGIKIADDNLRLKSEVERLRKAVMHSPAAQLKLKELEGKTTYEEINAAKDGKPSA